MASIAGIEQFAIRELPASRTTSTDKISTLSRPQYPPEIHSTRPPALTQTAASRAQRLRENSYFDRRLIACFTSLLAAGWSDASAGPLLPSIQAYYGLGYAAVSCIWISQAIGFIVASFANVHLTEKLGEGKIFAFGALLQCIAYCFTIPALPFPVICVDYCVLGFGMAIQDAQANAFVANLPSAAQKLGVLHAIYGLGALLTPLVATAIIDSGTRWSYAYAPTLAIATINLAAVVYGFRLEREPAHVQPAPDTLEDVTLAEQAPTEDSPNARLKRVLSSRVAMAMSFFIFAYVGLEVAEGGWLVSYLIDERAAGTRAGYVASGFWGGLTLGRLVLPSFCVWVGESRAITGLIVLTAGFEGLVWAIPSFITAAVFYAITGFLIGPIYPSGVSIATKLLPRSLHTGAIGFIASFGQAGSAIFPFIIGALAQKFGTNVLQPALLVMLALMMSLWALVPRPSRHRD